MSPVQILERAVLKKDVTLCNSSEIYVEIAHLFDQQGAIKTTIPDMTSAQVNVAWASDSSADQANYKFDLHKDTSVFDVFRQVTARRGEVLSTTQNYVLIRPSSEPIRRDGYQEHVEASKGSSAEKLVQALLPTQISLRQLGGGSLEELINLKMKEGWDQDEPLTF